MLSSFIDVGYGFLICWLLNLVQLAIAFLLLASSERLIGPAYVTAVGLGVIQISYIVPIYRLLWRKGKRYVAGGLLAAALITAVANFVIDYRLFGSQMLISARPSP